MIRSSLSTIPLPSPARYVPWQSGVYRIATGLHPLTRSFGNGTQDGRIFQFDTGFSAFRENRVSIPNAELDRYAGTRQCPPATIAAVCRFMVEQLVEEWPNLLARSVEGAFTRLKFRLTGDELHFDTGMNLLHSSRNYRDGLDALMSQVCEDVAIVQLDGDGRDRVAAVHVIAPSYWDPPGKLGLPFEAVHEPVPGMAKLNRQAPKITKMLLGPVRFQRFGWSIATDDRLNHHPEKPAAWEDERAWHGHQFDPNTPQAFVRVERQVLIGFPEQRAYAFFIRPCMYDCAEMSDADRVALANAVASMSADTLTYKNVTEYADDLIAWLRVC